MADKDQSVSKATSEKSILVWEAKEFTEYERNHRWYVLAGLIGGLVTVAALILQQWLAAVVFILATFVVIKHADDEARTLTYSISKLGVHVGQKFYPFNELKAYWLIYKPPVKTLHFQTTSRFKPLIKMDLGELDPVAVQETLKQHLPEQPKQAEDFLDKFSRIIRL